MDDRQAAVKKHNECCCCTGFFAFMLAACGVAIIVCGVVIVKPVVETNSLEFKETTCTTNQSYLTGRWVDCSCGDKCSSSYPCLRMTVTYGPSPTNGTYSAVLFDTEQRLNSDGDNSADYQCVTSPCARSTNDNQESVLEFNSTYAPGKTYSCLYHPDATSKVLLTRLFTWDAMFHSMLWPCIAFVIFFLLTCYAANESMNARKKMKTMPVTIPGAQPGRFLPPPAYPGGQNQAQYLQQEILQMAPPPPDPYAGTYATDKNNAGFSYN